MNGYFNKIKRSDYDSFRGIYFGFLDQSQGKTDKLIKCVSDPFCPTVWSIKISNLFVETLLSTLSLVVDSNNLQYQKLLYLILSRIKREPLTVVEL